MPSIAIQGTMLDYAMASRCERFYILYVTITSQSFALSHMRNFISADPQSANKLKKQTNKLLR